MNNNLTLVLNSIGSNNFQYWLCLIFGILLSLYAIRNVIVTVVLVCTNKYASRYGKSILPFFMYVVVFTSQSCLSYLLLNHASQVDDTNCKLARGAIEYYKNEQVFKSMRNDEIDKIKSELKELKDIEKENCDG